MAKSLRAVIRELIDEELLDELTGSDAAGPYSTPYAFTGRTVGGEKRRKKNAEKSGYSLVGDPDAEERSSSTKKKLPEQLAIPGLPAGELPADWKGHDKDVKNMRKKLDKEQIEEASITKPVWKSSRSGMYGTRKANSGIRYFEKEEAARAYRSGIKHAQRIHEKEVSETGDVEIVESPEQGREAGHKILDDMVGFVFNNRQDIKRGHMANDAAMMLRSMKQIIHGLTELSATAENYEDNV